MNKQSKYNELLIEIRDVISESRNYISRSVNYAQIISNWLVGRMIVEYEQKGKKSAEYGKEIIKYLAENLIQEFGNGYSTTNLKYFRQFYLEYPIGHSLPDQLNKSISHSLLDQNTNRQKQQKTHGESRYSKVHAVSGETDSSIQHAVSAELKKTNQHVVSGEFKINKRQAVSAQRDDLLGKAIQQLNYESNHPLAKILKLNLSWTHHRILLKVDNENAKQFYLRESHENNWSTRALDRQINSLYYERILSSQDKDVVRQEAKEKDDSPTIGIIMATEKDETIVKYSILNKSKQLFASKYKLFLPSEEELKNEIEQSKLNYKLKY